MARFLIFSAFVVFPFLLKAQAAGLYLYKGAVDKRPVTFLLRAEISACNGDTAWSGMYRYDGVSKWLFVHVEANSQNQFVLLEYGVTGVLMLTRKAGTFEGTWYSPDRKKALPAQLHKTSADALQLEKLQDAYNALVYELFDC